MNTIKSINFGLDVCSEMQPDFPIKRTCEKTRSHFFTSECVKKSL